MRSTPNRWVGVAAALLAVVCIMSAVGWGTPARAQGAFNWTGFYVGGHTGAGIDYNQFSNPYGSTLFGSEVRSPGPFIGGQFGYNYQSGQMVYGLQADATWSNLQGTATCMQPAKEGAGAAGFVGSFFGATCQAEPDWFGTLTARGGLAFGPNGRMLAYGKGGLAWIHNDVEMAQNNIQAPDYGPGDSTTTSKYVQWGWTLGAGLEYALSSRWSLGLEYDYLSFGKRSLATPNGGPLANPAFDGIAGSAGTDGRLAKLSQDLHAVKLAVNYALDDRGEPLASEEAVIRPVVAGGFARGLQVEFGGRYVHGWSRFQQDLGKNLTPLPANASRLTWESVGTNGMEIYGRIDTPWNVMFKTIVGVGRGSEGNIYDEDWGLSDTPITAITPYQLTRSNVTSSLDYFTIDAGYDVLRTDAYRIAPYIGYNYFHYNRLQLLPLQNERAGMLVPSVRAGGPVRRRSPHVGFPAGDGRVALDAARHERRADADAAAEGDGRCRLPALRPLFRRRQPSQAQRRQLHDALARPRRRHRRSGRRRHILRHHRAIQRRRRRPLLVDGRTERPHQFLLARHVPARALHHGAFRPVCPRLLQVRRPVIDGSTGQSSDRPLGAAIAAATANCLDRHNKKRSGEGSCPRPLR